MSEKFKTTWFYSSLDTYTKEVGLLRKKEETHYTERNVNFDEFATTLKQKYEEFDAEGYDVINVVPISMGQSEQCLQTDGNYVGDVGFSITRGAIIVGKLKENT